jgi:glutathione S-transferase
MARQLYDLAGAEPERRFSPYCWRIKLALVHKGLTFDTIPWRFTDKDVIAFSGQGFVPVLVDGDRVVSDSWKIAAYLEDTYVDSPKDFLAASQSSMRSASSIGL